MSTLSEKRVYAEQGEPTPVYVAAEQGLVRAKLSGDAVGEFSLARSCTARDVALGDDGLLALATTEETLVGGDAELLQQTGFGSAVAVSFVADTGAGRIPTAASGALIAATGAGRVARLPLDTSETARPTSDDWTDLGPIEGVRAIDGSLIAAESGVSRMVDDTLEHAGLSDVRDVAARGAPLAATGEGLYELGNGWMVARDTAHDIIATDGERAHAVDTDGALFAREGREWVGTAFPIESRPADVAYTPDGVVVATESGSLLVDAGDGWRSRALGVTGVQAVAAPRIE
ncbi:MAG: hypothetical protein V5A38_03255 [Halolamina sp.]|uniref:HVO_0234 family beta-propeller protein n=1 Tax=Halolamina sp. TaxID=1940283 RepID=UPI002FC2B53B